MGKVAKGRKGKERRSWSEVPLGVGEELWGAPAAAASGACGRGRPEDSMPTRVKGNRSILPSPHRAGKEWGAGPPWYGEYLTDLNS